MQKIDNWDSVSAVGEFERLELGGHKCKILKAEAQITKNSGRPTVVLFLDIADGPQAGYYKKQFENDTREFKRWPCQYSQITEGKSLPFFKGMITSIEKSNPGYKWNWDEKSLAGKYVGVVFGREQYKNSKGELRFSTKPTQIRATEGIENVPIPEDKLLPKSEYNYDPFTQLADKSDMFTEESDDGELPF
jgi:hypothetical protein